MSKKNKVVIPPGLKEQPTKSEVEVAHMLVDIYKTGAIFQDVDRYFERKSPDVHFMRLEWEIKSIKTNVSHTIVRAVQRACHQSKNIVLDARKCHRDSNTLLNILQREVPAKYILIDHNKKILDNFTNYR